MLIMASNQCSSVGRCTGLIRWSYFCNGVFFQRSFCVMTYFPAHQERRKSKNLPKRNFLVQTMISDVENQNKG